MDNLPEYTSIDVYVTLGRYRPLSVASAPESCSETSALEAGRQHQPYTLKVIRYAYSMSGNPGTWEFEDEGFVVDSDLGVGCNQIEVVEGGPGYILVINGRQINKSDIY